MARKKIKLVRIANDTTRKACLKKRMIGLCKKVQQLSILCGVDAFIIIYTPNENEPLTWPSRPEMEEMLKKYESIPETERSKKMANLQSYLKERIDKSEEVCEGSFEKERETRQLKESSDILSK